MDNTTSDSCFDHSSYDNALFVSRAIWRVCGFIFVVCGVPGHLLQIIISSKRIHRNDSTSTHFVAIAASELTFLVGISWLWCVNLSLIKTDPRQIFSCGLFYSMLIGSTILSNLYVASLSVDRSIMILYPATYRLVITRRHIYKRLASVLVIVVLFMSPHHFYLRYNERTTLFICELDDSLTHWRVRIWPFLHAILFVTVPSLITCIAAIILFHNRYRHRQIHRNHHSANVRRMKRTSILLLFTSIIMFCTILPTMILQIIIVHDNFFPTDVICSAKWKIYKTLLHCFFILATWNYSFKFYLRLLVSTEFRKDFTKLVNVVLCKEST